MNCCEKLLLRRRYADAYGAGLEPGFDSWLARPGRAVLGHRRAHRGRLFLEDYLDDPVEIAVSRALDRSVAREAIVELGNFAADNAIAMIGLWGEAANDLGGKSEIAVATLTAPLRGMFARIGVPLVELAPARAERLGPAAARWGSYYASDPVVCAGEIAAGQSALADFAARRGRSIAR